MSKDYSSRYTTKLSKSKEVKLFRLTRTWLFRAVVGVHVLSTCARADLENIAVDRPSQQSNDLNTHGQWSRASKANDGNIDGNFSSKSCIWIEQISGSVWWMVDLQHTYNISSIQVKTRDTGSDLKEFYLFVSKKNPTHDGSVLEHPSAASFGEICVYHEQPPLAFDTVHQFTCDTALSGRYVTVYRENSASDLVLCEVLVLADVPSELPTYAEETYGLSLGQKTNHSTLVEFAGTRSLPGCSSLCLQASAGSHVTAFQYQTSTGLCACMSISRLPDHQPHVHHDTDWTLGELTTN